MINSDNIYQIQVDCKIHITASESRIGQWAERELSNLDFHRQNLESSYDLLGLFPSNQR